MIAWLVQQGAALPAHLIPLKIQDHQRSEAEFSRHLEERMKALTDDSSLRDAFLAEMRRFLPAVTVLGTLENPAYRDYLRQTLHEQVDLAVRALK